MVAMKNVNVTRAAFAGLAGSAAYLIEQAIDTSVTGDDTDDLKLLGMLITRKDPYWKVVGVISHFVNGALLAVAYAYAMRFIPGPPWLRGVIFAQIENFSLWHLFIRPMDRFHPAVKSGDLPTYDRTVPFWQGVARHVAYGLVLGLAYGRGK